VIFQGLKGSSSLSNAWSEDSAEVFAALKDGHPAYPGNMGIGA
jgi:hypothetical protein